MLQHSVQCLSPHRIKVVEMMGGMEVVQGHVSKQHIVEAHSRC